MNTLKNYIEKYYVKNNYLKTLVITFYFYQLSLLDHFGNQFGCLDLVN